MNRTIFLKTLRDSAWLISICSAGIVSFVVIFVWAMLDMGPELLNFVSKFEFLRKIFSALGLQLDGDISVNTLFSVCFTHAMVLLLSWSVIIATSTRSIVGEIEQGTADLLLTLPVTRPQVYFSTSLVWMFCSAGIAVCPIIGVAVGTMIFETEEVVQLRRYIAPAINFAALLFAVGGLSSLASCLVERRGHAIAMIVGLGVFSMMLTFIEPFLKPIERFRFMGLLNYFRPVDVVRTGEFPTLNISILLLIGLSAWLAGLWIYCKKDVPTA